MDNEILEKACELKRDINIASKELKELTNFNNDKFVNITTDRKITRIRCALDYLKDEEIINIAYILLEQKLSKRLEDLKEEFENL